MADYIRREDALKALQNPEIFNVSPRLLQIIRELPAADVAEVVHGQWTYSGHDNSPGQFDIVKCSRCGFKAYTIAFYVRAGKYCINCGAKMDGGTENG